MCTTTAAALEFASRSSASTRSWSLRIRPSILTRAIEPAVVSALRPRGDITSATTAIAATATSAASTRQNVSLRRSLRRSTITSESSDIEILLKASARFAFAASANRYLNTSIAAQYEENKAPFVPVKAEAHRPPADGVKFDD